MERYFSSSYLKIYDIGGLVEITFPKATIPFHICSGFKDTGIWLLNFNIFSNDDYLPFHVTDDPVNLKETSTTTQGSSVQTSAENIEVVDPILPRTPN